MFMSEADFHYPTLDDRALKLALRIYENNPNYLDDPNCPYSEDVKNLFKGTSKVHDFNTHRNVEVPDGDNLMGQINELSRQLKEYGDFIQSSPSATPQDKNTYFRLMTSLLDKQIEQSEKVSNIKEYENFQSFILDFMDKELNADQRNLFMEKIKMLGGGLTTSTSSVTPDVKNKTEGETENALPHQIPAL